MRQIIAAAILALTFTQATAEPIKFEPTFADRTAVAYMQETLRDGGQLFVVLAEENGPCWGAQSPYGTLTVVSKDRKQSAFYRGCWVSTGNNVVFAGRSEDMPDTLTLTLPIEKFQKTQAFTSWWKPQR